MGANGNSASVNAGHLRAFIERIEKLEEEKRAIAADVKDVYSEAKGTGFDAKAIRKIVAMRRQDAAEREEQEQILDLYMSALGMLADTPLGRSAIERNVRGAVQRFRDSIPEGTTVSINGRPL